MAESMNGQKIIMHIFENNYHIQLDESTLPNIKTLLLPYLRFIKEEQVCREL